MTRSTIACKHKSCELEVSRRGEQGRPVRSCIPMTPRENWLVRESLSLWLMCGRLVSAWHAENSAWSARQVELQSGTGDRDRTGSGTGDGTGGMVGVTARGVSSSRGKAGRRVAAGCGIGCLCEAVGPTRAGPGNPGAEREHCVHSDSHSHSGNVLVQSAGHSRERRRKACSSGCISPIVRYLCDNRRL